MRKNINAGIYHQVQAGLKLWSHSCPLLKEVLHLLLILRIEKEDVRLVSWR
jgi:hypothetical protein